MTEATLSITNPDEILALFGPRDQHLRKLRRLFDVSITQRDGRIRISGEVMMTFNGQPEPSKNCVVCLVNRAN